MTIGQTCNIIWIKIFYIDNMEKAVCADFFIYIFDFITHFYNTFINIKLLLINYFYGQMVINVFVLLVILSDNKY